MGVVAAYQQGTRQCAAIFLVRTTQSSVQAHQRIGQKCGHSTLLGVGPHLFIVEAAVHRNAGIVGASQKPFNRRVGAHKVIESGG